VNATVPVSGQALNSSDGTIVAVSMTGAFTADEPADAPIAAVVNTCMLSPTARPT
jgi:hypothetical protein